MSQKNRLKMYKKLVAEGRLNKDDGSLVAEFGAAPTPTPQIEPVVEKKKGRK